MATERNFCTSTIQVANEIDFALATTATTGTITSATTQAETFAQSLRWYRTVGTTFLNGPATWAGQISVNAISGSIEGRFRLERLDSSFVSQSASAYSSVFTTTGVKTLSTTWDPGTWAAGDRLLVRLEIRRVPGTHGNVSITVNTTTDSYVDAQLAAVTASLIIPRRSLRRTLLVR